MSAKDAINDPVTVNINFRIDVKGSLAEENVADQQVLTETISSGTAPKTDTDVATINVQDQNDMDHEYGQYDFKVSDNRFKVDEDKTDGSQGFLKLKKGIALDFEAIPGVPLNNGNKVIEVKVTATPKSGNFDAVFVTVSVQVSNVASTVDDPDNDEVSFAGNTVPGLKDDETQPDSADEDDDTTDDDDDGGTPAPMDDMAAMASMLDDGIF